MRVGRIIPALLLVTACGATNQRAIEQALSAATAAKAPAFARDISWETLREIYAERGFAPLWVDGRRPRPQARELVDAVAAAESQGLRIGDYDLAGLKAALESAYHEGGTEPGEVADVELRLTALYLSYGRDLLAGRLDPRTVDRGWFIRTRTAAADSMLKAAVSTDRPAKTIAQLAPQRDDYAVLVAELARYRAIAAAGGWGRVSGARDTAGLRRRLAADSTDSVEEFRQRHGLPAEGGLDSAVLAAMNVPVTHRIHQIELNLERLRWLPERMGERYVVVNVPDFRLRAFDGGQQVLDMRVIVGEEYEQETPVFADTMSYVEFRPYWNVPRSILTEEIAPVAAEDPNYLRKNHYEVVPVSGSGDPVDPRSVDWDDAASDGFAWRVRQAPGDGNALGLVKFVFPNRFNIYMHDTPARHLFHRHRRALSHGCIRLEHPAQFAEFVLSGIPEWTPDRIDRAMHAEETRQVRVRRTLPVYILYLTAFAQDGRVQYRDDLYSTDARAIARLGKPASPAVIASIRETLAELMKG